MPSDEIVLQLDPGEMAVPAFAITVLGSVVDTAEQGLRHYSWKVAIPGVLVIHGYTPHFLDSPPDRDQPLNWIDCPIAFQRVGMSPATGDIITEFCVANFSSSGWGTAAGGRCEARRLAL